MLNLSKGGNINLAKEASGVTEFSIGLGVAAPAGVEFGGWASINAMKIPTIAFL